jgi:hypothetical protein
VARKIVVPWKARLDSASTSEPSRRVNSLQTLEILLQIRHLRGASMALPLPPGLTPPEIAFLCEMELVTVIPRQRLEGLELLGVCMPR